MNNWNYNPLFGVNQRPQGGLFDNIGGKLKTLAKVSFIIQTIFYTLAAILIGVQFGSLGILVALLVVGFLVFTSWTSCSKLYAYGELVEKATEIANNTKPIISASQKEKQKPKMAKTANHANAAQTTQPKATKNQQKQSEESVEDEPEDDNYISFNCPWCGEELAVSTDELGKSLFCPHCGQKIK